MILIASMDNLFNVLANLSEVRMNLNSARLGLCKACVNSIEA